MIKLIRDENSTHTFLQDYLTEIGVDYNNAEAPITLYDISNAGDIKKHHKDILPNLSKTVIEKAKTDENFFIVLGNGSEGYNADINFIENFCEQNLIPAHKIIFLTGNSNINRYNDSKITVIFMPWFERLTSRNAEYVDIPIDITRPYTWLSLNRIPRPHRALHVAYIHKAGIQNKFLWSLNNHAKGKQHIIKSCHKFNDTLKSIAKELNKIDLPKHLDLLNFDWRQSVNVNLHSLFKQAYFSVVTETSIDKNLCFITEKTFKPIINGHPFIIIGNPGTLDTLRRWGYKTYNNIFNETYDTITDENTRLEFINNEILRISNMDSEQIHNMYIQSKDIIQHNQKTFFENKIYMQDKVFKDTVGIK